MRRMAAAGGLVAVVALIVGQAMSQLGDSPGMDAGRLEVQRWLAGLDVSAGMWAGGIVEVLGLLALLVFIVYLGRELRRADPDGLGPALVVAGGVAAMAVKLGSLPPVAALLLHADEGIDPSVAGLILHANDFAFVLTGALSALVAGGAAATVLRTRALPAWLGWSGAIVAVALVGSLPLAASSFSPGFLLYVLWLVAASVVLTRRAGREAHAHTLGRPTPASA